MQRKRKGQQLQNQIRNQALICRRMNKKRRIKFRGESKLRGEEFDLMGAPNAREERLDEKNGMTGCAKKRLVLGEF